MNRWLLIGSLAALLVGSTGCLHNNVRSGCSSGQCASGGYETGCAGCGSSDCGGGCGGSSQCGAGCDGNCGNAGCKKGLLGRMGGLCGMCKGGGCRACTPGPLGFGQGGHDYSSHLQPGLLGHHAGQNLNNRPFTPGPPTGQVGYPYYTVRGPRDFLVDNPPTIGR
jgi:hypothetical protein